jgi:hypothetical protein
MGQTRVAEARNIEGHESVIAQVGGGEGVGKSVGTCLANNSCSMLMW